MPMMTQNDFLNPLFSLHPIWVALIIWVTGWGYLFFGAWKNNTLRYFLGHPGYMIGDFILLPLTGFLITYFYKTIDNSISLITTTKWSYFMVIFATFSALLYILGSFFITKTTHPNLLLFLPHAIFIWFMNYILINFLSKGLLQLLTSSTSALWITYVSVITLISIHLIFNRIFSMKNAV